MYKFYFCGTLNNFTFVFYVLQTMQISSHIIIKIWLLSKIIFLHVNNMAFFVPKIWTYHNCYFDKHNKEYLDLFYHLTKQILMVFFCTKSVLHANNVDIILTQHMDFLWCVKSWHDTWISHVVSNLDTAHGLPMMCQILTWHMDFLWCVKCGSSFKQTIL